MRKKYRKKPVVIEAIQYDGSNVNEAKAFAGHIMQYRPSNDFPADILIETLEGVMKCSVGDYIIKGVQGEFYPCKPDIFEATYESV